MSTRLTLLLLLFALFNGFVLSAQPNSFTVTGTGGGGYMYSPSINPHNHQNIYLACDMAGMYRTDDGGASWNVQHYQDMVSLVKAKVQFTSDPNILYTVRRSLTNLDDPLFRGELAKSTDGGSSWQALADPTATGVHRLIADPTSTNRLLLNEYDRLFFSNDGGNSWTTVYQPTDGQMWLGGAFWNGQNIYVGTGKGLLVSHDGGQNFAIENLQGLPTDAGIFQLNGARQNNVTRLFVITATASEMNAWNEIHEIQPYLQGMYRLNYAANAVWANVKNNIPAETNLHWVDLATNNTSIVYAAGELNGLPQVYKSTNGGQSWANTFLAIDNQNVQTGWGGDYGIVSYLWTGGALGLDVADNDPNLVITTDGLPHMTSDGGLNWRQIYVDPAYQNPAGVPTPVDKNYKSSGLNVTTGHHICWLSNSEILAGCTDIGNQFSTDGGESWTFNRNTLWPWGTLANPNWYRILKHPDGQTLLAAVSDANDMYLGYRLRDENIEWSGGLLLQSVDKGLKWDTLYNFGHAVVWLAMDEQNPDLLYASVVHHEAGGIFRSQDGGQSWTKLNLPARTEGHPYNICVLHDGGLAVTFSGRALEDGVTLTESSGVFYSPDGGDNWQDRSAPEMRYYTKDLVIDPGDLSQNTWYVTVWGRFTTFAGPNNAGNGGLYRTRDRGLHWERVFAHERTESITINPNNAAIAYVSVEFGGLYYSADLNTDNPGFSLLDAFPFPRPKRVFYNPYKPAELWVTTMGGALWHGEEPIVPVNGTVDNSKNTPAVSIFATESALVLKTTAAFEPVSGIITCFDLAGKCCFETDLTSFQADASYSFPLPDLPAAMYFVQLQNAAGKMLQSRKLAFVKN